MEVSKYMEVKDVAKKTVSSQVASTQKQVSGRTLATPGVSVPQQDAVAMETQPRNSGKIDVRARFNDLVNVVNIASDTTTDLEKIVKSLGGIVEQVQGGNLSQGRTSTLEAEANGLVDEIRKKADSASYNGTKPLAGDKFGLEAEEKLGTNFEFALPADAQAGLGIGKIAFSDPDSINSSVASVEAAQAKLKEIRTAVESTLSTIKSSASLIEVASQNSEAAQVSLRDVDDALSLAGRTSSGITANRDAALGSFSGLSSKSLALLQGR